MKATLIIAGLVLTTIGIYQELPCVRYTGMLAMFCGITAALISFNNNRRNVK